MHVRAIIKPSIYSEWRFSCACWALTISLKSHHSIGFFSDLEGLGEFAVKIAPLWHSLYTTSYSLVSSPAIITSSSQESKYCRFVHVLCLHLKINHQIKLVFSESLFHMYKCVIGTGSPPY